MRSHALAEELEHTSALLHQPFQHGVEHRLPGTLFESVACC
jgi:hypothetical protein